MFNKIKNSPSQGQQGSNPRPDGPPMDVCVCIRVVASRKRRKEKRGWARVGVGGRGKYPGAPPHHIRKKREKKQADRKVPDRPAGERGKAIVKKNNK
jgi:hypothetical protein